MRFIVISIQRLGGEITKLKKPASSEKPVSFYSWILN